MQEASLLHSFSLDLPVQVSETFKDLTVADCTTHSNNHSRERDKTLPVDIQDLVQGVAGSMAGQIEV